MKSTPMAVTFLDFAKVFDTVIHKILLDKLYNYEISDTANKLITSHLKIYITKSKNNYRPTRTGVPQSIVLT